MKLERLSKLPRSIMARWINKPYITIGKYGGGSTHWLIIIPGVGTFVRNDFRAACWLASLY